MLALGGCQTPAQYWIKIVHPWVQKFYPVLGLGSGERLLWHFQTPVLYWINSGCEWAYCHGTLLCGFSTPKCGGVLGGNDQNKPRNKCSTHLVPTSDLVIRSSWSPTFSALSDFGPNRPEGLLCGDRSGPTMDAIFCLQLQAPCLQLSFFATQLCLGVLLLTLGVLLLTFIVFLLTVGASLLTARKRV